MSGGPPGVELQESWSAADGARVAFPGVGVGLGDTAGVGERETWDVGVAETGDVDEGVTIPLDLGPQPATIIIPTTSPRTDLPLRLITASKEKRPNAEKVSGRLVPLRVLNSDELSQPSPSPIVR
jgi:hypothetical protein